MTEKLRLYEVCDQLRRDCDNFLIGMELLEEEIKEETPDIKKLIHFQEGLETWTEVLDTSMNDLEEEIKRFPQLQILKEIEK